MKIRFQSQGQSYQADLSKPLDISIPLRHGHQNPNAYFAPAPEFQPVEAEGFVGDTRQGSPVNFYNLKLNPHGNGTHTECVGHISKDRYSINSCLKEFHFIAQLASIYPTSQSNGDQVILEGQVKKVLDGPVPEALIIRTMPNNELKLKAQYSGHNPPYLHHQAARLIRQSGIRHLLIDLPSIDREADAGELLAHKAFWNYPRQPEKGHTITEMIYAGNEINDGPYLLNIQIASLEMDASPSKILLFELEEM